jgi:hypothetical protein
MSRAIAALLACALALGCESGERQPAPVPPPERSTSAKSADGFRRVVVVHLDTTRVDGIGCFGGIAKTPNIDELCRRGRRYTNAIAPTPLTSPSIASFMTGRLTHRTGVYSVGGALRDELVTLAEVLGRNGFVTGGFTSNMVVANRSDGLSWGFDQGFETYRAALDEPKAAANARQPHAVPRDNAAVLTREALSFVDETSRATTGRSASSIGPSASSSSGSTRFPGRRSGWSRRITARASATTTTGSSMARPFAIRASTFR